MTRDKYEQALAGKNIPPLTLDNKWHQLFAHAQETAEIKDLSEELNALLKKQGKLTNDIKDAKRLKKQLMGDIVTAMDEEGKSAPASKQMAENKRLIEECNNRIAQWEDEALEIPRQISDVNHRLMLATMESCYHILQDNTVQIQEIADWVAKTRVELKTNLLKKQSAEIQNHELYSYMHDIFGAEVIEIFDMKYTPTAKKGQE